ncbi:MAG TPA: M14 family zinc carboxypeptidase [Candidatus Dormibacteraeota bacterium]|nr:M14 family zinc carboxypeptidase [Candidatus Dormibacteraeota bacterium]
MSRKVFFGRKFLSFLLLVFFAFVFLSVIPELFANDTAPARDPKQPIDEEYTKKIREYTTQPFFSSPLVDYLPASKSVPTPKVVLGDVAGAPGILPYSNQVYEYMRMLEKASARVKVYSIGRTEEGREMIAVAVSSEANLARVEENRARLATLADPRTIKFDDAEADRLVDAAIPVYYITGTIHSPETGAPTALMELAYRLAVDESPYIQNIRNGVITLITPIVEVDGRDRMVDVYRWHLAHPKQNYPALIYWGKYVAHDNNRDAMGITLKLTENILNTFLAWKPQVLHDLHESVPYLYDNTAGDGPFNAWVDPILTDEWEMLGWHNVSDMTKFGMPGVFTHGQFDTWSPGYLMFIAAMHNSISRLYETFGNAGADTVERTLQPEEFSRTWFRQNPPLAKALWSQRNNNNYEQTGLLTSLHYFSENGKFFLKNFYLKSKRSVTKPTIEGPAAYVFPGDEPRPGAQAALLEVLRKQGCEVSRATAPFSVTMPAKKSKRSAQDSKSGDTTASDSSDRHAISKDGKEKDPSAPITLQFPAGSYIIRMDQPYSRIADALLDYQYWSPSDPQKTPYDDTGWSFGELFNVRVVRVTDAKILATPMERASEAIPGTVSGSGSVFVLNNHADSALASLRYRMKAATIDAAEEPFEAAGQKFNRGSFIIKNVDAASFQREVSNLGLHAFGLASSPTVKTHPVRAARIAIVHTWLSTQTEGWWRLALDKMKIPFDYISTQEVARNDGLNSKYDVILFPPVGRDPLVIVNGLPTDWGNPLPWKTTPETPNLGKNDSTDDMRPGLGWAGLAHLQKFVRHGGVLLTVQDTSNLAVSFGLTPGVAIERPKQMKIVGSVLRAQLVDPASPIAYGYGDNLSIYCDNGPIFNLSNLIGGRGFRRLGPEQGARPTGRGTIDDPDFTPGRAGFEAPDEPHAEPWEAQPVTDEQRRNGINVIPPASRPRVIFRYADTKDLLVSGLVDGGGEIAQHAAVIDVPVDAGHVILFSNNPVYRGETLGSYSLVLNTILNFESLNAGRKLTEK